MSFYLRRIRHRSKQEFHKELKSSERYIAAVCTSAGTHHASYRFIKEYPFKVGHRGHKRVSLPNRSQLLDQLLKEEMSKLFEN